MADRLVVLRDGRVQQVGTTEELHTRPANRHVADFMGYRNLLPLRVASVSGSSVTVSGSGMTLSGTAAGPLAAGDEVVAAIRPEDLHPGEGGLEATVEVVEYQGRELAVEARTAGGVVLHLRAESRPAPGDKIGVVADPSRVLVFPVDTATVSPGAAARSPRSVADHPSDGSPESRPGSAADTSASPSGSGSVDSGPGISANHPGGGPADRSGGGPVGGGS